MPNDFIALPHRKQEQEYTCTPACLRMVLAYHGQEVLEAELARLLGTTRLGTLFSRIADAAQIGCAVGIEIGTVKRLESLTALGHPCLVRLKTTHLPRYPLPPWVPHTVVVAGVVRGSVYYHDPAQDAGPDAAPVELFDTAWALGQRQFALVRPRDAVP